MGSNTLDLVNLPQPANSDDVDQYFTALTGDFLPRNATTGAVETNLHSLGSLTAAWKNAFISDLYIGGKLFNPDNVGLGVDSSNAIVSGRTRTTSAQADFLRASGSGTSMTILAATTPLQITASGISATIAADITVSSLTVAPSSNNTCLVNDLDLLDSPFSFHAGESPDLSLSVDAMGSAITALIGKYCCLKTVNGEYMLAFVESATLLTRCFRGFFFDSAGNPIPRASLANNDMLTLMSLGWVFMDINGSTVDVSYNPPIYDGQEPATATTDDYWFDMNNKEWNRYDGSDWVQVDRMLIGLAVIDTVNCVATRSFDFSRAYSDQNTIELSVYSDTQIRSESGRSAISVGGSLKQYLAGPIVWDITTDLETGLTEAANTIYYLYITEEGRQKISTHKPYDRKADLGGYYHPYNSWRCVGQTYNNASSNLNAASTGLVSGSESPLEKIAVITTIANLAEITNIPQNYKYLMIELSDVSFSSTGALFVSARRSDNSGFSWITKTINGTTITHHDDLIPQVAISASQKYSGQVIIHGYQGGALKISSGYLDAGGAQHIFHGASERDSSSSILNKLPIIGFSFGVGTGITMDGGEITLWGMK